jgi:protein translocase SecG subunit
MNNFVLGLLSVVAVLSSVLLMFVILLQEPKGGGIAAALGGSGMEAIGPAVGGVNRFTTWVAGIWMVVCFLHAVGMGRSGPTLDPVTKDKPADTQQPGPGEGEKPK